MPLLTSKPTRVLGRGDLLDVLDTASGLSALDAGFGASRDGLPDEVRAWSDLPGPGTATALLPGILPDVPAYTAKVNAKFPAQMPALRGVICLHDLRTGGLLALLDSSTVTAWRTGLAAALATHRLARLNGDRLGIVGAGAQADLVVTGLGALRHLERVTIFDLDRGRAEWFARNHTKAARCVEVVSTLGECTTAADVVIVATWAREPVLQASEVRPGQHVTSLGADEPTKRELATELLRQAVLVVDDRDLAASVGVVASSREAGCEPPEVHATIGDVWSGRHPGRVSDAEFTVYSPVGLPWQDLCLAWLAYERAESADVGVEVDLLA